MLQFIYKSLEAIGYYHPIHPTEVHMPIGLVVGGLAFSLAGLILRRQPLAQAARYCFILAFLFLIPTILFGIMDWQYYFNGRMLYAIKVKIVLSAILFVLVSGSVIVNRKGVGPTRFVLPLYVMSFFIVVALGYFGGELVLGGRAPNIQPSFNQAKTIFEANCAMCHPNGQSVSYPNRSLRNTPELENFENFITHLRSPKRPDGSPGSMPSIPEQALSDEQVWQLYQYIVHVAGGPSTEDKQK